MWIYSQRLGELSHDDELVAYGYSGAGEHKNRPESQHLKQLGPLPQGIYTIGRPYDSKLRGPFCLPLTPDPKNQMFGRSAFLMHGDSKKAPGSASKGCIILARHVRERVWKSGDNTLKVVV